MKALAVKAEPAPARAVGVTPSRGFCFSLWLLEGGASAAVWRLTFNQGFVIVGSMEAVVQNELFPVIEDASRKRSGLRVFMDAIERHGPMIERAHIPVVLDVSKQRVHQLVEQGRIATVVVQGRVFVPLASLELYLADERKNGRPVKEFTLRERVGEVISAYRKNRKKTS